MKATELVDHLRGIGVQLWVDGENLRFRAPQGVLGADLKAQLSASKPEVTALLRRETELVLAPDDRFEPFPLTEVQAAYLVGRTSAFRWGGVGCHGYAEFAVDHTVATPAADDYRSAWRRVVATHDMLRCAVHPDGYQVIRPDVADGLVVHGNTDAQGIADDRARIAEQLRNRTYRLGEAPMYDLVVTIGPHDAVVHVSVDLLIADFVSISIAMTDFGRCLLDADHRPPPPGFSFREYLLNVARQRESAAGARRRQRDLDYWHTRIGQLPPPIALPLLPGEPTASDAAPTFSRRSLRLSADGFAALTRLAAERGATASVAIAAALASVLGRYGDRDHFSLTLTTMGRYPFTADVGRLVGDFTGTSVLEVDVRGAPTFAGLIHTVGGRLFDDMDHATTGGVDVARMLARGDDNRGEHSPVVFTSTLGTGAHHTGAETSPLVPIAGRGLSQTPQVLLDCQAGEVDAALEINWDTRDAAIPAEVLDAAFADFAAAIEALGTDPDTWDRPLCPAVAPAATEVSGPPPGGEAALLHTGFVRNAAAAPEAVAIRHGERSTTYGELLAAAGAVADELTAAGVEPGDCVGVRLPGGPGQVAAIIGVLLAGAAYVPLDVDWPDHRVGQIAGQCALAAHCEPGGRIGQLLADPKAWRPRRGASPDTGEAGSTPDDTAYVVFTSGSTGTPKGVMMTHGAVLNTLADINHRLEVGAADSVLAVSQHTFDLSVYNIFGLLAAGGAIVFAAGAARNDPQAWFDAIADHRVTIWNSVPAQMQLLLDHAGRDAMLPSLRHVLLSGDWIPVAQPEQIAAMAPAAAMLSLGGATEAAIWSISHPLAARRYRRSVPYGTALRNQSVRVLTHRGELAAPWQTGEIHIGGAGLAQGYLGDPERTAAAFIAHPVSGERLYRTGDYGRFTGDGVVELLGRRDNQVKIRGHRIELAETDSALRELDGVHTAVTTVVGGDVGDRALAAAVVPETADADEHAERRAAAAAVGNAAEAAHHRRTAGVDTEALLGFAAAARDAALDAICAALGAVAPAGDRVGFDELARRVSLPDELRRLLGRWVDVLVDEDRMVAHPDSTLELTVDCDLADCAARWRRVRALGERIDYGDELLAYVGECIERLPGLLAGSVDALALLFPEASVATATAAYRDNLISRYTNEIVASAVAARASRATAKRPLRVLEIGGGVGGTTAGLVAALAEHAVRYTFTDVSQFFLAQAAEAFAERDFIDYRLFDLNRPPAEQGMASCSFDVIVSANVLHNAINIDDALDELHKLLAPGGSLVFIDATAVNHPLMISMEFKDGLHGFTDARAAGNSAFLTHEQWRGALARSPFGEIHSLPPDGHALARLGQHVFRCDSTATAHCLRPGELAESARELLPDYMIPQHLTCLPALPLTANGKVDRAAVADDLDALRSATRRGELDTPGSAAALDAMQSRIAEIWAGVLGLRSAAELSPRSDFFALGGDSLLLAQAIGRIRREMDEAAELAWDDLLRAMVSDPTLAAAAEAVQRPGTARGPDAAGDPTFGDDPAGTDSPLVYLGAGDGSVPATEIAVCVHDGSGGLAPYEQLVAQLRAAGDAVPDLYGLRRTAGDGYLQISPPQLFTTLAARYSEPITALAPAKVHLVGYCMGGLLAAELAKRLEEAGIGVATVTVASSYRVPMAIEDDDVLDYCFAQIMGAAPADLGLRVDDAAIRDAFTNARTHYAGVIPPGALRGVATPELAAGLDTSAPPGEPRMRLLAQSGAVGRSWTVESLIELRSVFIHSLRAVVGGAAEPFLGDIHFLRQRGDIHFLPTLQDDMTEFWRGYCLGELTVSQIDGNHFDCLTGDNAPTVAQLLTDSWAGGHG